MSVGIMRTAMVERVPRALTGFDEVKNSRSSDFSVALRWFLRSSELRYGSSGSSGRTPGRIPQRSQAQSRKSTSEVEEVDHTSEVSVVQRSQWSINEVD